MPPNNDYKITSENASPEINIYARNETAVERGDDIVISGMAGRFPKCNSIEEFQYNLYNKVDMVSEKPRWPYYSIEIPSRYGLLPEVDKFDANFFGISNKLANTMDPINRLLCEVAYEAILDAGVNPNSLRGTNTGIYIGSCFSEAQSNMVYKNQIQDGLALLGCSRSMGANRLAYFLGTTGPACLIDTACSSSLYALDSAFTAIKNGTIDAAIVVGLNVVLHPNITLQFCRLGVIALNGQCRPLDIQASGYTRAEGAPAIFLQRRRKAKRIYATVIYTKTNCDGYKQEGITFPSKSLQERLLNDVYSECGINPNHLDYIEAHSTGTVAGDPEECQAIVNALCRKRTEPLLLGSVKSNMGHSEAASALCSLSKILLAFETGFIAPNINFSGTRTDIPSLLNGQLKVVTDFVPIKSPLIAINAFGFGGANAHAVVLRHSLEKQDFGTYRDCFPRLFTWTGRTRLGVEKMLKYIESKPLDVEYLGLLQGIRTETIKGFLYRGFGIFNPDKNQNTNCITNDTQLVIGEKRPTVWIFTGFEEYSTEWYQLIEIPAFSRAICRYDTILRSNGFKLLEILRDEKELKRNIVLNTILCTVSVQLATIDVFRSIKWEPTYMIGQGFIGELICGYADSAISAEQIILIALQTGIILSEQYSPQFSQARIYLTEKETLKMIPPTIEIIAYDTLYSCKITGHTVDIENFTASLTQRDIRSEILSSKTIPWNSKRLLKIMPEIMNVLEKFIPKPKLRSSKWLSTCLAQNTSQSEIDKNASPGYFIRSLTEPVRFSEAVKYIRSDSIAVALEKGSHTESSVEKLLPIGIRVTLLRQEGFNGLNSFLTAIGRLYLLGVDVQTDHLYQRVEYPVARGTPSISSRLDWDHSNTYYSLAQKQGSLGDADRLYKITLEDDPYLRGHCIDGRVLIPATFYIIKVWELFMPIRSGEYCDNAAVEFEDIRFLRATYLAERDMVELYVRVQKGTGFFEITDAGTPVVQGIVRKCAALIPEIPTINRTSTSPILNNRDFYKELRLRGYHYKDAFRSVNEAQSDGRYGQIKWDLNWVAFLDCMLQLSIIGKDSRDLALPTRIQKLRINGEHHLAVGRKCDPKNKFIQVFGDADCNCLVGGGVEIIGLHATKVERRKAPGAPVLERFLFISHFSTPKLNQIDAVRFCVQLAIENTGTKLIKALEVDKMSNHPIIHLFRDVTEDLPLCSAEVKLLSSRKINLEGILVENSLIENSKNYSFVIATNVLKDENLLKKCSAPLSNSGILVCREKNENIKIPTRYHCLAKVLCEDEIFVLLQKYPKISETSIKTEIVQINQNDQTYDWLNKTQLCISKGIERLIIVSQGDKLSGVLGLVNCLKKEPLRQTKIVYFLIDDLSAPDFSIDEPLYRKQLELGLSINILRKNKWGTYRHLCLAENISESPQRGFVFADLRQRGDLSSWLWIQTVKPRRCATVIYAALNFRDVMIASGRLAVDVIKTKRDSKSLIGFEYSGLDINGQRIMGMIPSGALASHISLESAITLPVPKNWSLEEAATVPVVYLTVYYSFFIVTNIRKGSTILIHSGTGGVGLAAIRVALAYGLQVYATVGTTEKIEFLLKLFPQLKRANVGNSRDTSFEDMIKIQTNGKGVDYVLNSLSEDKLLASVRCLAQNGHFLEIGKFDVSNDSKLGLAIFQKGISFSVIFADELFENSRKYVQPLVEMLTRDIEKGIIQPLPSTVFTASEVEQAFRYMASGKHIGKVLIQIRESVAAETTFPIKVAGRIDFEPNFVYIISGGLGGFGLELADWMILRGARKIVLSSQRGITKGYQAYRIRIWESYGVKVIVRTDDITIRAGCVTLIEEALKYGSVGGIFNLAVALRDGIFMNQSVENFQKCLAPKAIATLYLDEISREKCPDIQHFVVFSSVSCGRGNAGQSNYGMANSVMERIVEDRVSYGLPGKAIQWGAVGEVGIVADMAEDKIDMEIGGTLQQRISSCLQELDCLLSCSDPIVASMVVAEKKIGRAGKRNIFGTVLDIIGIRDLKAFSMQASLSAVGLDSLMTVEVKQTLEREFEIILSPDEVRNLTFQRLQEISDKKESESGEEIIVTGDSAENKNPSENGTEEAHKIIAVDLYWKNLGIEKFSKERLLKIIGEKTIGNGKFSTKLIIPGVECVAGLQWHQICAKLSGMSYILQLLNHPDSLSVENLVDTSFEDIKNIVFDQQRFFNIIGYSYGSILAVILAKRLELLGFQGQILLIDGAPKFVQKVTASRTPKKFAELDVSKEIPKWNATLNSYLDKVGKNGNFSTEFCSEVVKAVYQRSKSIVELDIKKIQKIQSPLTLIRSSEASVANIEEDYGISSLTSGKTQVFFLEGSHSTILDNDELVDIIYKWSR